MKTAHPWMLVVLAAGCTKVVPATEVFVTVRSDIPAAQLGRAAIVVERPSDGTVLFSRCVCVGDGMGCKQWPLTLGLGPDGMDYAPFRVRAQGFASDCGAAPIVEQSAVMSFVQGSSLELDLYLYAVCEGVHCPTGKTCSGGACVTEMGPTPPTLDGGTTCGDHIKDGTETDVDCGGSSCPPCADSKTCIGNSDCASGSCNAGTCGKPPIVCTFDDPLSLFDDCIVAQ
jgi:hypothetical protein